jgi:thioredoxin 1
MINRRILLLGVALTSLVLPFAAIASSVQPFTAEALALANASGKPVLLEISAPWCPTCKVQGEIIGALQADARFKDLIVLRVDFDNQKDVLREWRVRQQSTLIVLKDGTETGRSIGATDPAAIEALIATAL